MIIFFPSKFMCSCCN